MPSPSSKGCRADRLQSFRVSCSGLLLVLQCDVGRQRPSCLQRSHGSLRVPSGAICGVCFGSCATRLQKIRRLGHPGPVAGGCSPCGCCPRWGAATASASPSAPGRETEWASTSHRNSGTLPHLSSAQVRAKMQHSGRRLSRCCLCLRRGSKRLSKPGFASIS